MFVPPVVASENVFAAAKEKNVCNLYNTNTTGYETC